MSFFSIILAGIKAFAGWIGLMLLFLVVILVLQGLSAPEPRTYVEEALKMENTVWLNATPESDYSIPGQEVILYNSTKAVALAQDRVIEAAREGKVLLIFSNSGSEFTVEVMKDKIEKEVPKAKVKLLNGAVKEINKALGKK